MAKRVDKATAAVGEAVTYTICVYNNSGADVSIRLITDTFPQQWVYTGCGATGAPFLCSNDGNPAGETIAWGLNGGASYVLVNGGSFELTITGNYSAPGAPWCNASGAYVMSFTGGGTFSGANDACVMVN